MNEKNQNYKEITINGYIENSRALLIKKFGFVHKRLNLDKMNDNKFFLSKSSINGSNNKINNNKLRLSLLGKIKSMNNYYKKISQSCNSLINNNNLIVSKKKNSRNYSLYYTNDNTNSRYFSSFFNNKSKIMNTIHNNTFNNNSNIKQSAKSTNKNLNNIKGEYNKDKDIMNVKPVVKDKDKDKSNIINSQLWSKLISNIDQKQNHKIKKIKNNYLNRMNININTNININIKNNISNSNYKNENNNNMNNINYCNHTTNNVYININNNSSKKNNNCKKYLPNISINDITNYNPPEKDTSTISIDEDNNKLKKESKSQLNKIIEERKKERNKKEEKKSEGKDIKKEKEKIIKKSKSNRKEMSVKKENKLHKLYSSSMFEDSNIDNIDNSNNNKREIKYCNSNSFKISSDNNDKKEKKETNNSNNEPSFIGDNNSYHRICKKSSDKDKESSEKENNNNNINNESDFTESNNNNRNLFNNYNNNNNKSLNIFNNNITNKTNKTNKTENSKIHKLLSRNYSFNVSSRDIYDYKAKKFEHQNPNINYRFITDIEKSNCDIINLSKKKFMNLTDISIYKILSFSIDSYLPLINSDKYIKKKINISLNNLFESVINDFKYKYKNYFEVIHYKFEDNKIKSFYDNNFILDLVLNCKIISKNIQESIEISCNYISNNEQYDYLWKFDLQKKSKIKKWISSEINTMKNYHKTISYTSQVSSFSYGDEIQIQINVFNITNILEPKTLEWYEPIISPINCEIYENTKFINKVIYDPLRACEIEKQALLWHDKINEDFLQICEEVKEIYKNFFKIKNIFFDKSKFCFYKFVMIPYKVGLLQRNKYCSFDINIIDFNSPVKNEIQCIYLINTNNYTNKMDIRIGTYLTLYIIDMQVN